MNAKQAILARKTLQRRLALFVGDPLVAPSGGWVRAIREALGLPAKQLAARLGVVPSRVSAIEKAEVSGATTVKTLREVAEAMGCTFVYALVPKVPLNEMVRAQAAKKADRELARHDHTMRLENQGMNPEDLAAERERLVAEMLSGSLRRLWDEQ
jgi:predicted DNA-binding mobile mystery protein A